MATDKDFPPTVIFGYDRHRQNGQGSVVPQGAIVKASHWGWKLASFVLILGILAFIFFPSDFVSLVKWVFSFN
jgi:hypothetical protein